MKLTNLRLPAGFEIDAPFIVHRYSDYCIVQDETRHGGWCVVRDAVIDDDYSPVYSVVTFHDSVEDACTFVNALTNPHIVWVG